MAFQHYFNYASVYGGKDNTALLRHSQIVTMVPYVTYSCMGIS